MAVSVFDEHFQANDWYFHSGRDFSVSNSRSTSSAYDEKGAPQKLTFNRSESEKSLAVPCQLSAGYFIEARYVK